MVKFQILKSVQVYFKICDWVADAMNFVHEFTIV